MLLLDSLLRPPSLLGPDPLVRLVADVGADGLAVGSEGMTLPLLESVLVTGAPVRAATALLPETPLASHKRLPSLCADDADERQAALALVEQSTKLLVTFDVRLLTLALGAVTMSASPAPFWRSCERRTWDDPSTDGPELREAALGERKARSARLLDNARFSLERLMGLAERSNLRFALEITGSPWGFPSPREALVLVGEYRGAPLGSVWDRARLAVLGRLGLAQPRPRLEELATSAALVREHDAVGWEVGFLAGLGEPAPAELASVRLNPSTPLVLSGRPDTSTLELVEAVAKARAKHASAA